MASFSVLIVTAAPPGMGAEAGGAFVKVDGREAVLRSAELFLNRDNVKQIQVVILPDMLEEAKRKYAAHFGFSGIKMISGGPKWMNQVAAGGPTISEEVSHVILHDAARPAVPYSDIDALMEQAEKSVCCVLTSPLKAPLAELDEGSNPVGYRLPDEFVQVLTPQAFTRERFITMAGTEQEVHASETTLVKGSPLNIRLSGPGEAGLLKAMINMLPKPKTRPPSSPFEEAQW